MSLARTGMAELIRPERLGGYAVVFSGEESQETSPGCKDALPSYGCK